MTNASASPSKPARRPQWRWCYLRACQACSIAVFLFVGWVVARWLGGLEPLPRPLHTHFWSTTFLLVAPVLLFGLFGFLVGRHEDQLFFLSLTDPLTELYNKRYFRERLLKEHANAQRHRYPMTIALLDLDRFKQVNDRFGHAAGDRVLERMARVLRAILRRGDTAARVGGEEFALLLPHCGGADAERLAERLRQSIQQAHITTAEGQSVSVTTSIGLASNDAYQQLDANALYSQADSALYRAKNQGRNCVVLATPPTEASSHVENESDD